ncbi:MAG: glycosyltransferase [Acidimicrobiales bacterium]
MSRLPERSVCVLHVLPDLALGGGQVIVRNLVSEPVEGVRHEVAALRGGVMADSFARAGVPVWVADARSPVQLARAVRDLAAKVRREGVDVIHTNNTPLDRFVGVVVARVTGRPTVNTLMAIASSHRPRLEGEPLTRFARRRAGNLVNRAVARFGVDQIVALSDTVRRAHAEALKVPCERIEVLHPGVPTPEAPAAADIARRRQELGLDGAYPVLICVGRLEENKGQRDLPAALARIVERLPDACLLLAGDGPDRARLERSFAEAGLADHVRVLGQRQDVPVLLRCSQVLVSTAHHEGFGMAVLEAMAAGCAVAAYDNDHVAIREFVTDGVDGRLVAEDPQRLAAAVMELADSPERLGEAGRAAAAKAAALTSQASARRYASLYRDLATRRRG